MNDSIINATDTVTDVATNIVSETQSSSKVLKGLGVTGALLLVGGLAYTFVVKPLCKKHKDKKQNESTDDNTVTITEYEAVEDNE